MTKINIIAQDLRQDEVSINAVHIFEYLDDAIDKVFNKIDRRIARNNERIGNINQRWVEIFSIKSFQAKALSILDSRLHRPSWHR